ncbi:aminoacyl tRNA synthase complex-interacting multifunctional protein 2 isoform X2 [Euwallacea fornicatus]|uniref:aminoacyl tRNA synthase complex-interacting multifunctional protein 2 isoform X2 n=1 Tax=Euwallacea fornicatus TaxID=995702 RepID=UPI00338E5105
MKAPIKMYHLKPLVVHDFAVDIPKCMYQLSNIHESKAVQHVAAATQKLDIFDQSCQGVPGMAQLEARQEEILAQLAQLKQQIFSLKQELNIQNGAASIEFSKATTQSLKTPKKACCFPDSLVVTVNPSAPPYSLELLQQLLRNDVALVVTSHLHSSISLLPDLAIQLKESLEKFRPPTEVPVINIKLIWKNISSNSEILLAHTLVSGEVNLLRYLSRLGITNISYDADRNSLELDSLLDQCYLLARTKTKAERANIFQVLNKSLGKSSWLAGRDQASIADIAAFSAIRQNGISNELNANLTKWYQQCISLA